MTDKQSTRGPWWRFGGLLLEVSPYGFAVLAFGAGGLLLASSATPQIADRLDILSKWLPLLVIELSHFLASAVGVMLLVVAAGLWRRRRGAYWLALILLALGVVFSFLKALDIEEAVIFFVIGCLLAPCRNAFDRPSRLVQPTLSLPWFGAVMVVIITSTAFAFFAYRNVDYTNDFWWTFLRDGQAPRFFRSGAFVALLVAAIAIQTLLSPPRQPYKGKPSQALLARAETILTKGNAGRAVGWLALTGNKDLFFSPSGRSFLMFRGRGRHWFVMGDPVGEPDDYHDLLWEFVEEAARIGVAPVFYGVGSTMLPELVALGMVVRKVGEEAVVDAATFSIAGKGKQNLRTANNRAAKDNLRFEVLAPGTAAAHQADLALISQQWLAIHGDTEKSFSVGTLDINYINRTPLAVVWQDDRIIAFANLWLQSGEVAIDLMRYGAETPHGVMDYLFLSLVFWARDNGHTKVNLGMAPLGGLQDRRLAPALARLGALVFEHGNSVYGFEGLRAYKNKFGPKWEPVYIASAASTSLPFALFEIALMTSGGWRGLFPRKSDQPTRTAEAA